jgi:hypothetical protein
VVLSLSCASQLSRSVTNEMKRLTCCCSGSGDQQLRDPEPAFEVVGVLQAGERHEAGHRPEQRLVVATDRDGGVEVKQRRDHRAVGGLDRRGGRRGGVTVDRLTVCREPSQLPERPVEGLADPGVVGVGVQPTDELPERRSRPVDTTRCASIPSRGTAARLGLAATQSLLSVRSAWSSWTSVLPRTASWARSLRRPASAPRASVVPIPTAARAIRPASGRMRMATTLERIGACRSMGSFLALQGVGRCGPPGMMSLVCALSGISYLHGTVK